MKSPSPRRAQRLLTIPCLLIPAASAAAQTVAIDWYTIDGGGTTIPLAGGIFTVTGTIGQPDAGILTGPPLECQGGFWSTGAGAACYANCDGSTVAPILNVNDFICFQTKFAANDTYANCDGSTVQPVLNVNDFICFQTRFAQACP